MTGLKPIWRLNKYEKIRYLAKAQRRKGAKNLLLFLCVLGGFARLIVIMAFIPDSSARERESRKINSMESGPDRVRDDCALE